MNSSDASTHPLDNVIWSALTHSHQAMLAIGKGAARRYPPDYAPFGAVREPTPGAYEDLAALLAPGEQAALFTRADVTPSEDFEVLVRKDAVQLIRDRPGEAPSDDQFQRLGSADVTDMLDLVEKTKPGPFSDRTQELGAFFGKRVEGHLVAMAGERMRLDGYTEVSAVCTRADFRGHGLARQLVEVVCSGIAARGEVPFLHAFADNRSAIALYQSLGFSLRAPLRLSVLRRRGTVA
ncbi:MAG TPA: GNAT family N-acetyltransferase [Variovorax sp.]|jgi:ribosomal protein S18 acetylase RimI-like enzyme